MAVRKKYRCDGIPSELERDAKCQMEPLLAGALVHRLSDIERMHLNAWVDMERRAAADEIWERHQNTIYAAKDMYAACKASLKALAANDGYTGEGADACKLLRKAITKYEGDS